jgi:hypothetical protein
MPNPQRAKHYQWLDKPGVKEALASGKSLTKIAALAGVSRQAVGLYRRKHFEPALQTAAKAYMFDKIAANIGASSAEVAQAGRLANSLAAANPLVERSEALWQEAWTALQDAKRAVSTVTDSAGKEHIRGRNFSVIAPLINAAAKSLELFGRGSGYLQDDVGRTQVLVVSGDSIQRTLPTKDEALDDAPERGTIDLAPDDYTKSE